MNKIGYIAVLSIAVLFLGSCTRSQSVNEKITREKVLKNAYIYLNHKWTPTEKNIFHGIDKNGVQVHTPNINAKLPHKVPGWWVPNKENVGIPYKWGGFDTIEEFDKGVKEGKYAGDINASKRKLVGTTPTNGVCKNAVGLDCAGFVSKCWGLKTKHSTAKLPKVMNLLPHFSELKPGDVLNIPHKHVMMFIKFTNKEKTKAILIHATSYFHKVVEEELSVEKFIEWGYKPCRYKNIVD